MVVVGTPPVKFYSTGIDDVFKSVLRKRFGIHLLPYKKNYIKKKSENVNVRAESIVANVNHI